MPVPRVLYTAAAGAPSSSSSQPALCWDCTHALSFWLSTLETAAASAETVDVRAETADPPARTPAADDGFMRMAVPFGPFLALGAIEYLFIGRFVVSWTTGGVFP